MKLKTRRQPGWPKAAAVSHTHIFYSVLQYTTALPRGIGAQMCECVFLGVLCEIEMQSDWGDEDCQQLCTVAAFLHANAHTYTVLRQAMKR